MEIEEQGYKKGHNPLHGELTRRFDFPPVPYGHKSSQEFIANVHETLSDIRYLFFGEVKLIITLFFDEKKRMETPELGDLDNYAKLLCDSMKGPKGFLIDDTQIQSLSISWIDTHASHYFEIRINGVPDEFVMKPVGLYEMPDRLFYPISTKVWTDKGIEDRNHDQVAHLLAVLHEIIQTKKDFRHELRQSGYRPLEAFWHSRYMTPILAGFHKSRVVELGFKILPLKEWKKTFNPKEVISEVKTRMQAKKEEL